MSSLDHFERQFLFGLTRSVAMTLISLLLAGIVLGALGVLVSAGDAPLVAVAPAEVLDWITPAAPAPNPAGTVPRPATPPTPLLPALKLPFALQKYFSTTERVRALQDWLVIRGGRTGQCEWENGGLAGPAGHDGWRPVTA
jgi:hypothetical protein